MADTLYATIGGRLKLNAAVELFYQKVLADESLRPFFEGVGMEHIRAQQSMFLAMLLGGKLVYTGRDVHSAHARPRQLGLNDSHFDAFLKHFRAALEEVGVPPYRLNEVLRLLQPLRETVIKP